MAEVRGGLDQAEMREVARWRFAKLALIRFVSAPSQKCRVAPATPLSPRLMFPTFFNFFFGWILETSWPVRMLMVAQLTAQLDPTR
jgi:hypothetical protein